MGKKLTEGQKLARKIVREAAKQVIAEMDKYEFRRDCVAFDADFHLACWRYDKATFGGRPMASGMPVYVPLRGRLPR